MVIHKASILPIKLLTAHFAPQQECLSQPPLPAAQQAMSGILAMG